MFVRGTLPLNVMVAKKSHCTLASEIPKSVATSERRIGSRQSLSIRGFFAISFLVLFGFGDDAAEQRCFSAVFAVPDFRDAYLERISNRFAPDLGAFIFLGPIVEHFFHSVLRRVAVVH